MKKFFLFTGMIAFLAVTIAPKALADDSKQDTSSGDKVPIKLKLPKPNFGGTPLNYTNPHLEPPSFKKRPPFLAPEGTTNMALHKKVTSSAKPIMNPLSNITNGDKEYAEKNVVELPSGDQWVQIDLGQEAAIYAVVIWHYHAAERVYFDVAVKTADDANLTKNGHTIFNNDYDNSAGLGVGKDKEYIESYKGKLIDAGGVHGRYVRLYSNGNTTDNKNHYIEVSVYAKPLK